MNTRDTYPVFRTVWCIYSLRKAIVLTVLGPNWWIRLVSVIHKNWDNTVFVFQYGSYRFKWMSFTVTNAPANCQRAIGTVLNRPKLQCCVVYLDDATILSQTLDNHLTNFRDVLKVLRDGGTTLNSRKCDFFRSTWNYLGHIICPGRLSTEEARVKSLPQATNPYKSGNSLLYRVIQRLPTVNPEIFGYRWVYECAFAQEAHQD